MRWGSGADLLEWDDPLALQNSVELVCFYVLDDVSCTRWPADLDAVDFGRGAQTKVHAEITLRERLRHNCRGFEQPGKRLLEYRFQCSDSCTVVCNGTSFNRPAGTATRGRPMRRRLPSSLSSLQSRSDRGQRKRAGLRRTIVGAVTSRETHARLHRRRSGDFLASRRSHCLLRTVSRNGNSSTDPNLKLVQSEDADSRDSSSPVAARPYCWCASGACRLERLATQQRATTKHLGR